MNTFDCARELWRLSLRRPDLDSEIGVGRSKSFINGYCTQAIETMQPIIIIIIAVVFIIAPADAPTWLLQLAS